MTVPADTDNMAMVASPRPADDDVPVSIEPVVGWRAWRLVREESALRLGSLVHGGSWAPQEVRAARCARSTRPVEHAAPERFCTCGYYATDSWTSLVDANVFGGEVGVIGAIGMWGTLIEHSAGARSEFAYPARLRLVCAPCIKQKVVRDPVTVIDLGHGMLSPRCERHVGKKAGVPAKAIEWELLNTYGVELLPKPAIPRRRRWGIRFEPGKPRSVQVGIWAVMAVFMVIRFLIGLFFVLWMVGSALTIAAAIVGVIWGAVTGQGRDPTPTPSVVSSMTHPELRVLAAERHRYAGVEAHRGRPPVSPLPNTAVPCGVALGDHVRFARCGSPQTDVLGFGQQRDPLGAAKDCIAPTDAYSSGPHWYVCWILLPGASLDPRPSSPNPFVHPLGGALR